MDAAREISPGLSFLPLTPTWWWLCWSVVVRCYRCFRSKIFFKQGFTDWWTSVWGMWQGVSTRMQVQGGNAHEFENLQETCQDANIATLQKDREAAQSVCMCVDIYICMCVYVCLCVRVWMLKTGNWLSVWVCVRAFRYRQSACVLHTSQTQGKLRVWQMPAGDEATHGFQPVTCALAVHTEDWLVSSTSRTQTLGLVPVTWRGHQTTLISSCWSDTVLVHIHPRGSNLWMKSRVMSREMLYG